MGRVVVVNSGTTTNLSKLKALAEKAIALVEAKLPGTTTYEFYVDEETSRFTWHEEYAGGEAIVQHLQVLVDSGLLEELPEIAEFDFAVALGDPENPKATAAMKQMGFGLYGLHARKQG